MQETLTKISYYLNENPTNSILNNYQHTLLYAEHFYTLFLDNVNDYANQQTLIYFISQHHLISIVLMLSFLSFCFYELFTSHTIYIVLIAPKFFLIRKLQRSVAHSASTWNAFTLLYDTHNHSPAAFLKYTHTHRHTVHAHLLTQWPLFALGATLLTYFLFYYYN